MAARIEGVVAHRKTPWIEAGGSPRSFEVNAARPGRIADRYYRFGALLLWSHQDIRRTPASPFVPVPKLGCEGRAFPRTCLRRGIHLRYRSGVHFHSEADLRGW